MIREYEIHFNNRLAEQTKDMNSKFAEQTKDMDSKFAEQTKDMNSKFAEQGRRLDLLIQTLKDRWDMHTDA